MIKRNLVLLILIELCSCYFVLASQKKSVISNSIKQNNSTITITSSKKNAKKIIRLLPAIDTLLKQIDNEFGIEKQQSYTNQLNTKHEVVASKKFVDLFQQAYEISLNTKGIYTPTDYTYEQYWAKHKLLQASKMDSIQLDTLYKYNVFSGFVSGDSIYEKDTFHILFLEDFIFQVSFENLLPAIKLSAIIDLLNSNHLTQYTILFKDQIYYAKTYFNGKYEFNYDSKKPNEYGLKYQQNFEFIKNQYRLLKQSNEVRVWTEDAIKACAYSIAFCNTKLNNNHAYWRGLIHFETEFK